MNSGQEYGHWGCRWIILSGARSVGSAWVITVLAAAAGSVVSADCSSSSAQALRFVFSSTWQCSPKNISLLFFHFADWLRRFIYLNPIFYSKFPLENGGTSDLDVAGVGEFIVKVGEPGEGLYIIFKGKVCETVRFSSNSSYFSSLLLACLQRGISNLGHFDPCRSKFWGQ